MVVAAYGLILPKSVLEMPRLGCINVHGSLLPRSAWCCADSTSHFDGGIKKQALPLCKWTLAKIGATLYKMACPISEHDTSASLHDRLALSGGDALLTVLEAIDHDEAFPPIPQMQF